MIWQTLWQVALLVLATTVFARYCLPILGTKNDDFGERDEVNTGMLVMLFLGIGGFVLAGLTGSYIAIAITIVALATYVWMALVMGWDPERD
jgi:hypothetical protein